MEEEAKEEPEPLTKDSILIKIIKEMYENTKSLESTKR